MSIARYLTPAPVKPSYASEHRRMKPLMELVRKLDVASNPAPEALFEAGSAGFQIWCSPADNPGGKWKEVQMFPGAFAKPAEYVASVHWKWDEETIVGLEISTCAYALADRFPEQFSESPIAKRLGKQSIRNRAQDLAWAGQKIEHLFCLANMALPAIYTIDD
jgi:hypothetical protein